MNYAASKHLPLLLIIFALWLLAFPYAGIVHDARLYTLQALANLHPGLYEHDIFLRYGSQDRFTVFTPIYSVIGSWIGIEHAAALLTLLGAFGVLGAGWLFSRQILSPSLANLALGLLVILPSHYGADLVFSFLEPFVTPRPFAEALVLLGIIAYSAERLALCWVLFAIASALHPIMAIAGPVYVMATITIKRTGVVIGFGCLFLISGLTYLLSTLGTAARFDHEWLEPVALRNPYLFLENWSFSDWARTIVPLCTLAISTLLLPDSRERSIGASALLVGIGGLVLTLAGSDWLRVILITQGQPWRWLWLSTILALLYCPYLFQQLWNKKISARTPLILIAAAWLIRNEPSSLGLGLLSLLSAICARTNIVSEDIWRRLIWVSWALLTAVVMWLVALNMLPDGSVHGTTNDPEWLNHLRRVCRDNVIPLAILMIGFSIGNAAVNRRMHYMQNVAWAIICVVLAIPAAALWTRSSFTQPLFDSFVIWREKIPAGQDVLWHEDPVSAWLLLQRPNYLSSIQTAATLFSRNAAIELNRRSREFDLYFPGTSFMDWERFSTQPMHASVTLHNLCKSISARFVVTRDTLESSPLSELKGAEFGVYSGLKLYDCDSPSI